MSSNHELENQDSFVEEIESSSTLEDFIKQLEEREKDLDISASFDIEFDTADFDDTNTPEFIKAEVEPVKPKTIEIPPINQIVPNSKTFSELEDEIAELKKKLLQAETERLEMVSSMRRRQTDFDNYKKRIERERGDTFINQLSNLAGQILPVLDNMNRALDFAEKHSKGKSADFQEFYRGIVMVNQQLNEVLAVMGILPITAVGQPFDPHYHEAVATEPHAELPPNTVTEELLRGYRIGMKVIRAAMVKVSVAPKEESAEMAEFTQMAETGDFLDLD